MSQHDYVIDNQSAPAARADINAVLQAIATTNSGGTAPVTTYANQIWYDTAANQLKKRNEANSAWIVLGTIDEGTGTFTPSGERALASQAQAEAGTDNTTLMTPLRTEQHMTVHALGYSQTWQAVSRTSGVSYQNTTGKPIQVSIGANNTAVTFQVSTDNSSWVTLGTTGTNVPSIFFAVIPNGHYYRATGGVSTTAELR